MSDRHTEMCDACYEEALAEIAGSDSPGAEGLKRAQEAAAQYVRVHREMSARKSR